VPLTIAAPWIVLAAMFDRRWRSFSRTKGGVHESGTAWLTGHSFAITRGTVSIALAALLVFSF